LKIPQAAAFLTSWLSDLQAEADSDGGSTRVMRHMFRRIIAGDYFPVPEVPPAAASQLHAPAPCC